MMDESASTPPSVDASPETALRSLRSLFENLEQSVIVMRGMAAVDCNEAALRMYGLTDRSQLIGRTPMDFSPPLQPDGRSSLEVAQEVIARTVTRDRFTFEWLNRRPNGELFLSEVRLAVLEPGDEPVLQCLVSDITVRRRTEQALEASEARYKALYSNLTAAVLVLDGTVCVQANEAAARIFGLESWDGLAGKTPLDYAPERQPDGRLSSDVVRENVEQVFAKGIHRFEWETRRVDGKPLFLDVALSPLPEGDRVLLQCVATDITARVLAERELMRAHDRLQSMLDALPDLLFEVDAEGRIFDFRAPDVTKLYAKPEDFLGRRFRDILPERAAEVLELSLREADREGRHSGATYSLEMHGATHWYELSIAARGSHQHGTRRFVALVRDITERRSAQEALRFSEEFLRESQRVSGVGSYVLDLATGTWSASETMLAVFGLGSDHPRTIASWAELIHPGDREGMLAYFESIVRERREFDREYRIIRRSDGAERWIHGLGVLAQNESGIPVSMTGTIQDVTERYLAAQEREHLLAAEQAARIEAERAVKARDEFLSVAAHELKTPLAALRIVAEALMKRHAELEALPDYIEKSVATVDRQSQRLIRLVNALLDITRIQTGRFDLVLRPVDVAASLRAVIHRLGPSLEQAGCAVRLALPDLVMIAACDRDRIEQVFENLLSNAMKFAPRGALEVTGTMDERKVEVTIRDHGRGIPEDQRGRIFDLYDRGDAALHAGGLGIGLFVCRRILEAHSGSIAVRNAEGGGAAFTVTLPV